MILSGGADMQIVCIMGKSGSGKSTIESKLEQLGYNRIISYTTRSPRGNEQSGKEYYFVTEEQFDRLIDRNILMESATYNGHRYGAPKPVGASNNVIVVEADGFRKIKQLYGKQAIGIYIDVSDDIIEGRLKNRGDTSNIEANSRKKEDDKKFSTIKNEADLVIDGNDSVDISVLKIITYLRGNT